MKYLVSARFAYYDEFDFWTEIPITVEVEADNLQEVLEKAIWAVEKRVQPSWYSHPVEIKILEITDEKGNKIKFPIFGTELKKDFSPNTSPKNLGKIKTLVMLDGLMLTLPLEEKGHLLKMIFLSIPTYHERLSFLQQNIPLSKLFRGLFKEFRSPEQQTEFCITLLRYLPNLCSRLPRIIRHSINNETLYQLFLEKMMLSFLKERQYYSLMGAYFERKATGFYNPLIVRAARFYEKAGKLERALQLYQRGIEECDPTRINVYAEKTGEDVSAVSYPEANAKLLKEAERLVNLCKRKVQELQQKISQFNEKNN